MHPQGLVALGDPVRRDAHRRRSGPLSRRDPDFGGAVLEDISSDPGGGRQCVVVGADRAAALSVDGERHHDAPGRRWVVQCRHQGHRRALPGRARRDRQGPERDRAGGWTGRLRRPLDLGPGAVAVAEPGPHSRVVGQGVGQPCDPHGPAPALVGGVHPAGERVVSGGGLVLGVRLLVLHLVAGDRVVERVPVQRQPAVPGVDPQAEDGGGDRRIADRRALRRPRPRAGAAGVDRAHPYVVGRAAGQQVDGPLGFDADAQDVPPVVARGPLVLQLVVVDHAGRRVPGHEQAVVPLVSHRDAGGSAGGSRRRRRAARIDRLGRDDGAGEPVAVQGQGLQVAQSAQFERDAAGEPVVVEVQLPQGGQAAQLARDFTGELIVAQVEILKLSRRQVAQFPWDRARQPVFAEGERLQVRNVAQLGRYGAGQPVVVQVQSGDDPAL